MQKSKEEIQDLRNRFPSVPEYALPKTKKKKSPANQLADDISRYCKRIGAHFQRINTQGNYNAYLKKWTFSGATRGASDCLITYQGKAYHVEIKIGKDKLSAGQIKFKESVESAGGVYMLAKDFESWKREFEELIVDC